MRAVFLSVVSFSFFLGMDHFFSLPDGLRHFIGDHKVEMESLQFVGCSWFIGLIGLVSDSPKIKFDLKTKCALPCSPPVSSSIHIDAQGVHSTAGYVAIPPRALTDPESR